MNILSNSQMNTVHRFIRVYGAKNMEIVTRVNKFTVTFAFQVRKGDALRIETAWRTPLQAGPESILKMVDEIDQCISAHRREV